MLKAVTSKQIQRLDQIAIQKIGIPSLVLMENAGKAASVEILKYLHFKKVCTVVIICGVGNNGGDGFVIARYLVDQGIAVHVFLIGQIKQLKPDARINFLILKKLGIKVQIRSQWVQKDLSVIRQAGTVVDCLFGVGLNRILDAPLRRIIELINQESQYIISIDVPSGLDATTGKVFGNCIKADKTITFTYSKKGFYTREGTKFVGKIKVVDIGIPEKVKKVVLR